MNLSFLNDKTPLEAALYYAKEMHWLVFPLHNPVGEGEDVRCSCGRDKCENLGKHPRVADWTREATIDTANITKWWKRWPHANIGICTGTSFLVIDFDFAHGGLSSFPEVLVFEPTLKNALAAQTGGGGRHLFVRIPLREGSIRNRVGVWPGVDIRADRGYVVGVPSLHSSLQRYQWAPAEGDLIELSEAFIKKIQLRDGAVVPKDALRSSIIPSGKRNDMLFRIAAARVAKGTESFEDTLSFLRRINHERCDPPLEDDEIERITQSAYTYPPSFLQTDLGNARAIKYWFGKDLRWTKSLGWLEWEDDQWNEVTDVHIRTYVHLLSEMLLSIAKAQSNEALNKWAHITQSGGHISAAVKELQSEVEVKSSFFEGSNFLLPCSEGTLELSGNGRFRSSSREDYMLRRLPIRFDASATCPRWEAALNLWLGGDEELITYVQRIVGYCLTGDMRHQCFFILYGSGANGKSTFIRTILSLLGAFSVTINSELLMKNSRFPKETEIARLFGVRLAVCSESASEGKIDAELIKKLTGGENITGRRLYKDAIEFKPTAKIMLHTNHKPIASTYDDALWRRIIPIPFTVVIPKENRNPLLPWQLLEELPGILAWAVRGTHEEREEGKDIMSFPKAVAQAREKYFEENDPVRAFIEETVIQTENDMDRIFGKDLYNRYCDEMRRARRGAPISYKTFNTTLRERQGLKAGLYHNLMFWTCVKFIGSTEGSRTSITLER